MKKFSRTLVSAFVSVALLCALMAGGLTTASAASAPGTSFIKTYSATSYEAATCIRQTTDGAFVFSAITASTNPDSAGYDGNIDSWVVRLNTNGTEKWKKRIGGSGYDYLNCIQQISDGGFIACGVTESNNGNISGNHGSKDAWVTKIDAKGNVKWSKCFGGTKDDSFNSVIQTADGGYLCCGSTNSTDGNISGQSGVVDGWAVKLSSLGALQWQKCIGSGSRYNVFDQVIQTSDKGYMLCGTRRILDDSSNDIWLVRLLANGNVSWEKAYGGSEEETSCAMAQAYDGSFTIACSSKSKDGNVSGNHGNYDIWVFKVSSSGVFAWGKSIGGSSVDNLNAIDRTLDGGVILAGGSISTNGDIGSAKGGYNAWLIKLSATGAIQWKKAFCSTKSDISSGVVQTKEGGYVLCGATEGKDGDFSINKGNLSAFVISLKRDTQYKKPALASVSAAKTKDTAGNILKVKAKLTTTANASLKVTIYNAKGKIVAILSKSTQFSGNKEFLWNGKATAGNTAKLKTGAKVPIAKTGTTFKYKIVAANVVGSSTSKTYTIKLYA
jgi:hypothetical protein